MPSASNWSGFSSNYRGYAAANKLMKGYRQCQRDTNSRLACSPAVVPAPREIRVRLLRGDPALADLVVLTGQHRLDPSSRVVSPSGGRLWVKSGAGLLAVDPRRTATVIGSALAPFSNRQRRDALERPVPLPARHVDGWTARRGTARERFEELVTLGRSRPGNWTRCGPQLRPLPQRFARVLHELFARTPRPSPCSRPGINNQSNQVDKANRPSSTPT